MWQMLPISAIPYRTILGQPYVQTLTQKRAGFNENSDFSGKQQRLPVYSCFKFSLL